MTRYDRWIVGIVVAIAVAGYGFTKFFYQPVQDQYISIEVEGKQVQQLAWPQNASPRTIEVRGVNGITYIQIDRSGVRVLDSACPDKLCVKSGTITRPPQMIVCLPNRVAVRIVQAQGVSNNLDGITH